MELRFPITTDMLAVVSFWLRILRARFQENYSITIPQFRVLSCLNQQRNLHLHEIAEMLDLSSSTTTYIVDKVEEQGWVQRKPVANNRRVIEVELSPEGFMLAQQGYEMSEVVKNEMIEPLGRFLKGVTDRGLDVHGDSYLFQAKTNKFLNDGTSLNVLTLYENRLNEILKQQSLSNTEFRILFELETNSSETHVGDLARALLSKISEITVACNKLESNGYILRNQSRRDRRVIDVDITSQGLEKVKQAAPDIDEVFMQTSISTNQEERNIELKASAIIAKTQRKKFLYA